MSAFPDELYQCPRSWAEQAYPKLIHYNRLAKGGHFAAWEQPQLLSEELRAGFKSLRPSRAIRRPGSGTGCFGAATWAGARWPTDRSKPFCDPIGNRTGRDVTETRGVTGVPTEGAAPERSAVP